ncbi:MAG: urea ABC transporter permease subunit UrtB [Betaproteobacteria bacterium]|nr:urea ABC transporter permease subunit UrtB [Betaproteobacteria bacterium]MBU6510882.1 urea ABC transporter permease subunit UrtB [Betaproteobacteria bacterium]MDE1954107.1 urea ABC transporter permease subunit UrtB [Betaproteobacteria bacterium]MDE2151217.1 urea ABC transporter permease subunit UrtB [Betaproteobacteria bacterium]MDE2478006.1 urea ABC transporter permease subunit UrtB [Betaproteobacteria bacterium]
MSRCPIVPLLARLVLPLLMGLGLCLGLSRPALALDAGQALALSRGGTSARLAALHQALQHPDATLAGFLGALLDNRVQLDGDTVELQQGGQWVDAATGKAVTPGADAQPVVNNNYLRKQFSAARAALHLFSADRAERLLAVQRLEGDPEALDAGLVEQALQHETDAGIRQRLRLLVAAARLRAGTPAQRLAAAAELASSDYPAVRALLLSRLQRDGQTWVEPDAAVRQRIQASLRAIDSRLAWGERVGMLFSGISLGSILLLAALGLAVTYGLMGVINMAQGEFIMLGAYATYVVQSLFQTWLPAWQNYALVVAVPCSFLVAGGVGVVAERVVIRRLYGRPLETLLATWGISLLLIQAVRSLFGPQNVQVDNPPWMSGGLHLMANLILPYNRMVILGFTACVLLGMALLIGRTRLGLFVRAVTQNRPMAACVGVRTARVDWLAFGLGTGIAGLAGCALSQVGNVSPEMGTQYIVDCFMVVVLGGVGQLGGTVVAALGLGVVNTLLEGVAGAVLAKIAVLGMIILFIQKRPQGLFALKGRSVEG